MLESIFALKLNKITNVPGDTGHGLVKAFIEEKEGLFCAWVRVLWDVGKEVCEYRLGADGAVDLAAVKATEGGKAYCDHLPVIGRETNTLLNSYE